MNDKTITPINGPPVTFSGECVFTHSTEGNGPRWTEINLYRTDGGNYTVETIGKSSRPHERDFVNCMAIETGGDPSPGQVHQMLDYLKWNSIAYAMADAMGWDIPDERLID